MALIEDLSGDELEVASEFLEMAARLVHIKTLALLPRHEEEAERLRSELTGELIEYQVCRQVAAALREMQTPLPHFVRPEQPQPQRPYAHRHDATELARAYLLATGRRQQRMPPPPERFRGIVGRRVVPVSARIRYLLRRLRRHRRMDYNEVFDGGERSERVATFIALLELIKAGRVRLSEDDQHIILNEGALRQYE
jgi:segregation and condensation protein A